MTAELLSIIQKNFPLTKHPYAEIAAQMGISEEEVLAALRKEKENSIIRQISPIFDTKRLGYSSSLVAFMMDEDKIDDAVALINSHPGISHNYERDHDFNIWFTLAVPPDSKLGLEKTVELLAQKTGAKDAIILPTLKMFKIAVKLNTTGKDAKKEKVAKRRYKEIELTPFHQEVIRHTQYDLPVTEDPFAEVVEKLGITHERLFDTLHELQEAGVMRRFAAILNHRKAGFNANAMVVWDVDPDKGEEIGKKAAEFSAVSHCYLRPKYENWPYNLFTMVHGKTTEETNAIIASIADEIEHKQKRPLYSTREFKKVRIKYYTPEFSAWEEKMTGDVS
ncbi:MAG: Lrp/AsnC family transcriptional regulator [Sulfurospirillum sp.]|nr:MAG: Lrp/AsnC family transcriptional regulator [Sulfurospirillum sp.]